MSLRAKQHSEVGSSSAGAGLGWGGCLPLLSVDWVSESALRTCAGRPLSSGGPEPSPILLLPLLSRSLSFLRVARPHCSSSSSRTGGTQTRQTAQAWPTSPATSPMWSACPSMLPPCTHPQPWQPSTAWMTMAQARNRCLGGWVRVSRPLPGTSGSCVASCFPEVLPL